MQKSVKWVIVVGVGAVSVYFDLIEAFVLYHMYDVGVEIVLVIARPPHDWLELLLGECECSEKSRLFATSLLIMRHIYLLGQRCREEVTRFPDSIGSSSHGHRGLVDG